MGWIHWQRAQGTWGQTALQALRERSGRYYASDLPNAPMEAGQYPSLGDVFAEQIREITEGVRGL